MAQHKPNIDVKLTNAFRKAGLSYKPVIAATGAAKLLRHPIRVAHQMRRRRDTMPGEPNGTRAAEAAAQVTAEGYCIFPAADVPQAQAIVALVDGLWRSRCLGGDEQDVVNKKHLVDFMHHNDLIDHPDLLDFVLSPPFVETAQHYFGHTPVLASVTMLWSPPNETRKSSQLFHLDYGVRQIKFFLNITDVTDENGPLSFVPAGTSRKIIRQVGLRKGRFKDEAVFAVTGSDDLVKGNGPAGTVTGLDTSRCLHFGSRENSKARVVLMIQFMPYLTASIRDDSPAVDPALAHGDEMRALLVDALH
ncbi:MAG: hypothetical protein O7C63_06050 [Alphaproteobacteria bacterium]|nr:hypothetical protein [Alphaproteobacteria bacterium]